MFEWVLQSIDAHPFLALFAFMALETAMVFPFVPCEVMVAFAAIRYGTTWPSLVGVVAAAGLGGLVGAFALYAIVLRGGRPLVDRYGRWVGLTPVRMVRLERSFAGGPGRLVFLLRLVPFVRSAVTIPAGLAKMPAPRFLLLSGAGIGVYACGIAFLARGVWDAGTGARVAVAVALGITIALSSVLMLRRPSRPASS